MKIDNAILNKIIADLEYCGESVSASETDSKFQQGYIGGLQYALSMIYSRIRECNKKEIL